jgi:poly(hydroxyalkanoate) depolymerase family esterase
MNHHYEALMQAATRLTRIGQLHEATQLIQRALRGDDQQNSDLVTDVHEDMHNDIHNHTRDQIRNGEGSDQGNVSILDAAGVEIAVAPKNAAVAEDALVPGDGEFISGRHTHAALTRNYKLFVPSNQVGRRPALVVMLHGCTQDSNDFAVGTDMNEHARELGLFVLYPEQSKQANPSRCWNWFKHNHQRRGSGEPALLASMTQAIIQQYDLDPDRVYIAGLSAGGAMAAIMADTYPDIFAAAGVHSGLPTGAAGNVSEAMAVMKSGSANIRAGIRSDVRNTSARPAAVAMIVFHGDQDTTVHPVNGDQVLSAALSSAHQTAINTGIDASAFEVRREKGISKKGRNYTRTIHCDQTGQPRAEHWLVHGAGHAWSGGQSGGSFTDPKGPDATREMLRFFLAQRRQNLKSPSAGETG